MTPTEAAIREALLKPEVRDAILHGLMVPVETIDREYPVAVSLLAENLAITLEHWTASPLRATVWARHMETK